MKASAASASGRDQLHWAASQRPRIQSSIKVRASWIWAARGSARGHPKVLQSLRERDS